MKTQLPHTISWAHKLLAEVVSPGDLTVDLTAGNGHDSLFLWNLVGESGKVLSFDIQEAALVSSAERLTTAGATVFRDADHLNETGVHLIQADHAEVAAYLNDRPTAAIANLGFLPGGDKELITQPKTTKVALQSLCEQLAVGGRIAIVAYIGHPGGLEEGEMLEAFCAELPPEQWHTLKMNTMNRTAAPWLAVLEKR